MTTKKPAVKKVSKKSKFADKDFDFNKFPSVTKKKPTAFPYEIDGKPAINCTKWQFMCLILAVALGLLVAMHGDNQALLDGFIH